MNKTKLWQGLTATAAMLLVIAICATACCMTYKEIINGYLGIEPGYIVSDDTGADTTYFKSEFGEMNATNQAKLVEATHAQTVEEMREGAVLLRNEGGALPLKNTERRVSVFGRSNVDLVYKNSSSGNTPTETDAVTLHGALEAADFKINPTLKSAYLASDLKRDKLTGETAEAPVSLYTDAVKESWANDYNDIAFIVLTRESGEGYDMFMTDPEGISQLALHKNERDMIELITSSGKFKKTVVLLNTPTPMELGWLEEYDIDACLWFGTTGYVGMTGVIDILVGNVNPSGKLVDTYAVNSLSAPAVVNSGTNTPAFTNEQAIASKSKDNIDNLKWVNVQVEGIYVGYKYYETRYEDCVLSRGGANATAGSSTGKAWNYAEEITYPFGYGLGYTTFKQTLGEVTDKDGKITVKASVKNTGSVAGKSVVEVYAQTPYGDYEKENLVEKSAIQLVGFAKTDMLAPGDEKTVSVEIDKYLLASYDYKKAKTYIMSEGDYYLAIGDNAHDALNNVLKKKGASGMTDEAGESVSGDAEKVYTWKESFDGATYSVSSENYKVTNQFADCDITTFIPSIKYITRADWAGTYPTAPLAIEATDEMIRLLGGDTYVKPENAPNASSITQGDRKGITLIELRGLDYDDPKWETYLSQLTLDELLSQIWESKGTRPISAVNKPAVIVGDGMDSISDRLPYGDRPKTNCYAAKVVLTSTWNVDLYKRRGELMGEEALYNKYVAVANVGGNLHRTPFGGRNFEYMSEDSYMSYLAGIPETFGMLSKGVNPMIKHFAGNDQEYKRHGVACFFTEQAFREGDLKAFEGAIRVGKTHALMQSLARVGCTYDPAHYGIQTEVLRNEWGFRGVVETDGTAGSTYKHHFKESLTAGTSVYCLDVSKLSSAALNRAITKDNDGNILLELRRAVKDYHYALANSCGMNGISANSHYVEVVPWWETALYVALGVLSAATAAMLVMFVLTKYNVIGKKESVSEEEVK